MPGNLQNISLKFRMGLWEMFTDLDNRVRTDLLSDNVPRESEMKSEIGLCFTPRPAVVLFQGGDQSIPLLRARCSFSFGTLTLTMYRSCSRPAYDNGSPVLRCPSCRKLSDTPFPFPCKLSCPCLGLCDLALKSSFPVMRLLTSSFRVSSSFAVVSQ